VPGWEDLAAAKAVAPHVEKVIVFDRVLCRTHSRRAHTRRRRGIRTGPLQAAGVRSNVRFPCVELELVDAGTVRMRIAFMALSLFVETPLLRRATCPI
jgi:hypothetical protein